MVITCDMCCWNCWYWIEFCYSLHSISSDSQLLFPSFSWHCWDHSCVGLDRAFVCRGWICVIVIIMYKEYVVPRWLHDTVSLFCSHALASLDFSIYVTFGLLKPCGLHLWTLDHKMLSQVTHLLCYIYTILELTDCTTLYTYLLTGCSSCVPELNLVRTAKLNITPRSRRWHAPITCQMKSVSMISWIVTNVVNMMLVQR